MEQKKLMPTVHERDRRLMHYLDLDNENCWVAGGAARAWYEGQPVASGSDIDIFFRDRLTFSRMENFLNTEFQYRLGVSLLNTVADHPEIRPRDNDFYVSLLYKSDNALTYRVEHRELGDYRIQMISKEYFDSPNDVINRFDISVCQVATDGHQWWTTTDFVRDLRSRTLRFVNQQPDMLKRLIKYWVYGFEPAPEILEYIRDNEQLVFDFQNGVEDYNNAF